MRDIKYYRFVISDLHLKGSEALIYSVIYDYTVEEGAYNEGLDELAKITGITYTSVSRLLTKLRRKGLIESEEVYGRYKQHSLYRAVKGN